MSQCKEFQGGAIMTGIEFVTAGAVYIDGMRCPMSLCYHEVNNA